MISLVQEHCQFVPSSCRSYAVLFFLIEAIDKNHFFKNYCIGLGTGTSFYSCCDFSIVGKNICLLVIVEE